MPPYPPQPHTHRFTLLDSKARSVEIGRQRAREGARRRQGGQGVVLAADLLGQRVGLEAPRERPEEAELLLRLHEARLHEGPAGAGDGGVALGAEGARQHEAHVQRPADGDEAERELVRHARGDEREGDVTRPPAMRTGGCGSTTNGSEHEAEAREFTLLETFRRFRPSLA